ncbi:hypothetical protein A0J61_09220 [Choanephora cucurbitarum]|uniref:Uncharacterized protein n=1 Tax=Choanephora cucurbitarum TaxID=101091 RepID=A0A1C7N0X3_9FUNG|nr:hypothetical protein A0J61_09220 [Choanephora cucurbitarum]
MAICKFRIGENTVILEAQEGYYFRLNASILKCLKALREEEVVVAFSLSRLFVPLDIRLINEEFSQPVAALYNLKAFSVQQAERPELTLSGIRSRYPQVPELNSYEIQSSPDRRNGFGPLDTVPQINVAPYFSKQ